jgi:CHASE2 domain-containing sensor protein
MLFIVRTNLILLILFAFSLSSLLLQQEVNWFLHWAELLTLGSVAALQIILLTRARRFYGFVLVLLYTLALIHGLKVMLSLGAIDSAVDVLVLIFHVFLVVFFIGVRGYLRSDRGRSAMGLEVKSEVSDKT